MGRLLGRAVVSVALVALVAATNGGLIPSKSDDLRSLLWKSKLHRPSVLPTTAPPPTLSADIGHRATAADKGHRATAADKGHRATAADKGHQAAAKPGPADLRPHWHQQLLQHTSSKPAPWKGPGAVPTRAPRPAYSGPTAQPSANAIGPAAQTTGSPKPKLETTTQDRTIITAPLRRCPEGQRMGPDRQCRPDYSEPEDDD